MDMSISSTAGCAIFEPWAGFVTGFIAGFVYVLGNRLLLKLRLDDAVDAIPVHLFSGLWGMISVGFFTSPAKQLAAYGRADHSGLFYEWWNGTSDATLLGVQLIGTLFIVTWVSSMMLPFFFWLDYMNWLRCDALEEIVGLDATDHGGLERVQERPDTEDVKDDHYEAYKRRRQHKNTEILNRRSNLIHRLSSATSDGIPDDNNNDSSMSQRNNDHSYTTSSKSRS
jgi:Ammonium Transporter Family